MRHLEPSKPQPQNTRANSPQPAEPPRHPVLKFSLLAAALILAGGFALTHFLGGNSADNVPDAKRAELVKAFSRLDSVKLDPVPAAEVSQALADMRLPPDARQRLRATLADPAQGGAAAPSAPGSAALANRVQLVWLTLWDSMSPDGDVVRVSSAGYEVDILLEKVPQRIAVPIDATRQVQITGIYDGGGGITLGVQQGAAQVMLPVLAPAEILHLPVSL